MSSNGQSVIWLVLTENPSSPFSSYLSAWGLVPSHTAYCIYNSGSCSAFALPHPRVTSSLYLTSTAEDCSPLCCFSILTEHQLQRYPLFCIFSSCLVLSPTLHLLCGYSKSETILGFTTDVLQLPTWALEYRQEGVELFCSQCSGFHLLTSSHRQMYHCV